jgi:hypothetical protein
VAGDPTWTELAEKGAGMESRGWLPDPHLERSLVAKTLLLPAYIGARELRTKTSIGAAHGDGGMESRPSSLILSEHDRG